jgi:flagellar motor protein MotB
MTYNQTTPALLAGLLMTLPLAAGCVSNSTFRKTLSDREAEIKSLREERVALKIRIQNIAGERDTLEVALAEASLRVIEAPAVEPMLYPGLDDAGVGYGMVGGNLVLTIPSSVTFGPGQAALTDEGMAVLQTVATTLMAEHPTGMYFIEGHTDADPISKSKFESNRDLSLARAMAVLRHLVETSGLADDQCVVVGHGQYHPVAGNDNADGKAMNRRVEIVIHE